MNKKIHIDDPYGYIKSLIKEWYKKSELEEDIFNKFICLWISFNAFYSNCNDKDIEDKQIKFIADNCKSFDKITENIEIIEFHNFINNRQLYFFTNFNKGLLNLLCYNKNMNKINLTDNEEAILNKGDFKQATNFNGLILKGKTSSKNVLIRYYDNINNLNAFLFVLYQIRCNLFHGGKNPEKEHERNVIEKAVPALNFFLKKIYKESNILD